MSKEFERLRGLMAEQFAIAAGAKLAEVPADKQSGVAFDNLRTLHELTAAEVKASVGDDKTTLPKSVVMGVDQAYGSWSGFFPQLQNLPKGALTVHDETMVTLQKGDQMVVDEGGITVKYADGRCIKMGGPKPEPLDAKKVANLYMYVKPRIPAGPQRDNFLRAVNRALGFEPQARPARPARPRVLRANPEQLRKVMHHINRYAKHYGIK